MAATILRKRKNEPGFYTYLNNARFAKFTGCKRKVTNNATQRFCEVERVTKKSKISGEVCLKILIQSNIAVYEVTQHIDNNINFSIGIYF